MDIPLRHSSLKKRLLALGVGLLLLYLLTAYVIAPAMWVRYARRHPSFDEIPRITYTRSDHPGDPLNVSLIGTERQLTSDPGLAETLDAIELLAKVELAKLGRDV